MKGFTPKLQCPEDLLKKLKWNLQKLEEAPSSVYAAFDFFVTAEHIPDWIGNKEIRRKNDLMLVVSHIANGAKHFEVSPIRHKSVSAMESRADPWPDESGIEGEHIFITFSMADGAFSGLELSALSLARRVYEFWEAHLGQE